jgi:Ca2+-binding EF-hand superfamily protein
MAEFLAASESAEEAAEKFLAYDASGDGIVSAEECLESMGGEHDRQEPPAR